MLEHLTVRLWAGVDKTPATQEAETEAKTAAPGPVTVADLLPEELFRSVLNENQLKALDDWQVHGNNPNWEVTQMPVRATDGTEWSIRFFRNLNNSEITCALCSPGPRERCFHAHDGTQRSINTTDPWTSAYAFLCKLQNDVEWVAQRAG